MTQPYFIGLMSGTSADGIDAVIVTTKGEQSELIGSHHRPMPAPLRQEILAFRQSGQDELHRLATLDVQLAEEYAAAVSALLEAAQLEATAGRTKQDGDSRADMKAAAPKVEAADLSFPTTLTEEEDRPEVRARLTNMHDFINTVEGWYNQMIHVPPQQIMRLIRLGSKVVGLLKFVGRKDTPNT